MPNYTRKRRCGCGGGGTRRKNAIASSAEKPKRRYKTFHNYSDKYIIEDYNTHVKIYGTTFDDKTGKKVKGNKISKIAYKDIMFARDPFKHTALSGNKWDPRFRQANILIHVGGDQYMFVGFRVVGFRPFKGDEIYNFIGYMGNNEVMYSYAVGKLYTYLLMEDVAIPNNLLKPSDDPYGLYYGSQQEKKEIPGLLKMKVKVLDTDLS